MTIDAPRHASAAATTHVNRTFIAAPVDTVWSLLVATDTVLPFFFGAICDTRDGLRPGARMRMVHPNRKIAMVVGEVLAFEPPHLYAHTFRMTHIDEPPATVTYRLTPADGGTMFELEIAEARRGGRLEREMLGAQKFIGTNLKALAETGKPAFSGRMVMALSPLIAMTAKKEQRIANWPLE
ncbi:SRPBCC domain-containing protein [Pseudooceanicola sp. LIPI14-2-Ac024]|uniref:SRPBCC domain-containing protein n=1 Tax=Pseudooceanicola sp. LIPI14-2-Ac024 TaxID=3344875 RepID=UPI0035CEF784